MKLFVVLAAFVACIAATPMVRIDPEDDWRVVGGSTASGGQFPFIVSQRSGSTTSHMCGGSILNSRWILSAAHCLTGSGTVTFVAGSNQLLSGGTRFSVSRRILHANYNPSTIANDVAVVQLGSNIAFTTVIQPVSLTTSVVGGNVAVTLAGWGRLSQGGSIPNNLQFLHKSTITNAVCQSRVSPNPIFATSLCTTTPSGQGACHGDSGGPLVLRGTFTQAGIVSWGIPCGRGFPDVYARVSSFIAWINNAISS
ncbi:chymotrypsin-2-like [Onthophagus taurus]|uniref:chymotrypsin-2-like n=1 Tax=Onthophagus taurus TaxID=166361 RepID=UPI0039BE3587